MRCESCDESLHLTYTISLCGLQFSQHLQNGCSVLLWQHESSCVLWRRHGRTSTSNSRLSVSVWKSEKKIKSGYEGKKVLYLGCIQIHIRLFKHSHGHCWNSRSLSAHSSPYRHTVSPICTACSSAILVYLNLCVCVMLRWTHSSSAAVRCPLRFCHNREVWRSWCRINAMQMPPSHLLHCGEQPPASTSFRISWFHCWSVFREEQQLLFLPNAQWCDSNCCQAYWL